MRPKSRPIACGEAVRQQRLGRARRAFEQYVPAGEQCDEHQIDGRILTDDGFRNLLPDFRCERLNSVDLHF